LALAKLQTQAQVRVRLALPKGHLQALLQKLFAVRKQFLFRNLTGIDVRKDREKVRLICGSSALRGPKTGGSPQKT
jgi:hypothetical protein